VLKARHFTDISFDQWLTLAPRQITKDTLGQSDKVLDPLPTTKGCAIATNPDLTALADGGAAYVESEAE
jgi:hypothetical protein